MLLYFSIMWTGTFFGARYMGSRYENAVVQAFTASSNNFELAIAVAVGVFGINSKVTLRDQLIMKNGLICCTLQDVINCTVTIQIRNSTFSELISVSCCIPTPGWALPSHALV